MGFYRFYRWALLSILIDGIGIATHVIFRSYSFTGYDWILPFICLLLWRWKYFFCDLLIQTRSSMQIYSIAWSVGWWDGSGPPNIWPNPESQPPLMEPASQRGDAKHFQNDVSWHNFLMISAAFFLFPNFFKEAYVKVQFGKGIVPLLRPT